jgi:hypothetical protein
MYAPANRGNPNTSPSKLRESRELLSSLDEVGEVAERSEVGGGLRYAPPAR